MHAMFLAHILFGAFLVYTGWKAATSDEDEDDDPSQNPLVQWLSRRLPFVGAYDAKGSFFVKVPVNERGQAMLPCAQGGLEPIDSTEVRGYGTVDFNSASSQNAGTHTFQWRATMLFLVVVCLEVSDILFAVDSVSAIVAQVPDLFLAYTSAIFAMLGLRATFFVVDELVKLFTLLKYGVAAVLIFIGFKLMFSRLVHVPASIVFCLLFGILSFSMVSSVVYERYLKQKPQLDKANASA
jgi:tellurite resistance protein TerC